ncbi:hypothetical protein G5B97_03825 [Campylobacter concisus]|uniref:hypothetical protein n=1 Tax=Campylobacter concisus TaxID=199 RepID=UPI0018AA8791|nr:hypothetical protein [Campylobacter concisus]QPH99257.1 hypothetical protein G5B98_03610 [Campylobacter concisus]QPI01053.1 hypothetical protein G5B97_03825 [Campylobacter concisus]
MRKILLFLAIFSTIFASQDEINFESNVTKNQSLSSIPPAKITYINLEPEFCDNTCLNELIKADLLASFMARFEPTKIDDDALLELYISLGGEAILKVNKSGKIAVIIPQKIIKSYANVVSNAVLSYVLKQDADIEIKFINSNDESPQSLTNAMQTARVQGFNYFIAALTSNGANIINSLVLSNELIYIPSVHSSFIINPKPNLIFGGIDYKEQISALLAYSNEKIVAFDDGSSLGQKLNEYVRMQSSDYHEASIVGKDINLNDTLSKKSKFDDASIFLNIPIVKASLVATQMRGFEIKPYALLSTQINFLPNIFNAIAQRDRQNLFIANSLNPINDLFLGLGDLFDVDFRYSQIGYSSAFGAEYIYTNFIDKSADRIFTERVENSQVLYGVKIYNAKGDHFDETNQEILLDQNSSM